MYFFIPEDIGSTRKITDSTGPDIFKYKYTGQEYDSATRLYNYKSRFYDPVLGRFIQPDSLVQAGSPTGMNRYMYVNGNPMKFVDPSGHSKHSNLFNTIIAVSIGQDQNIFTTIHQATQQLSQMGNQIIGTYNRFVSDLTKTWQGILQTAGHLEQQMVSAIKKGGLLGYFALKRLPWLANSLKNFAAVGRSLQKAAHRSAVSSFHFLWSGHGYHNQGDWTKIRDNLKQVMIGFTEIVAGALYLIFAPEFRGVIFGPGLIVDGAMNVVAGATGGDKNTQEEGDRYEAD